MTVQKELQDILTEVKMGRWTPELFDRVKMLLDYVNVFNILWRELSPEKYEQFDLEYCSHYRPQVRKLTEWLTEERKVREWKKRRRALLMQKRKLLSGQ